MLTRIPPIFFRCASPLPMTTYKSFGHFNRTLSPNCPKIAVSRQASTTARPNRYCIKTSFDAGSVARDVRRNSENWRHPRGDSHTLLPRPRPASCWDARDRIGAGRRDMNIGFLGGKLARSISEAKLEHTCQTWSECLLRPRRKKRSRLLPKSHFCGGSDSPLRSTIH